MNDGAAAAGTPSMPGDAGGDAGARPAPASDAGDRDARAADAATAGPSALAARVCPAGVDFGSPLPSAAPSASLVQGGFGFLEGPVWVGDRGWLLFSDIDMSASDQSQGPPSRIRRLSPPSAFDVFVQDAHSNGLALDVDGALLGCTHDVQSLSRFALADGARETRALTYMGAHFNSPNDLTVRSDGTVYFSDPSWQLGPRSSETQQTGLYRVSPDDQVTLVDGSLSQPNGVALSPDEHTLYAGSQGTELWAYPVADDGSVGARSLFASPGSSDGLGVDCAGNLYVATGEHVLVLSPSGMELGAIAVAETPANVAFGGADRKTLYITARTGLYAIALGVPGLPY